MDATGTFGLPQCKVFVGGLPHDAEKDEVLEAIRNEWSDQGVAQVYYRGQGHGWATVEFVSKARRDEFLKNKERFRRILNVKVDIKEYKDKVKHNFLSLHLRNFVTFLEQSIRVLIRKSKQREWKKFRSFSF